MDELHMELKRLDKNIKEQLRVEKDALELVRRLELGEREIAQQEIISRLESRLAGGGGEGIYVDYRGWRFHPPFICMGCGIVVSLRQWCFSRSCGPCDVSSSKTRRVLSGKCFAGPRFKLSTWSAQKYDIPEDHFIDPKDRKKYPVMFRPMPKPPRKFDRDNPRRIRG